MWNSICNWHLITLRSFGLFWAHKSRWEVLQGNKMYMCLCQYTPTFKKLHFSQWGHINCSNTLVRRDSLGSQQMLPLTSTQNFAPQPKGCCLKCLEIEDTLLRAPVLPEWHPAFPYPILNTIWLNYSVAALSDELRRTEWSFGSQQGQDWGDFSLGEGLRFDTAVLRSAGMCIFVSCVPDEHPKQPANL